MGRVVQQLTAAGATNDTNASGNGRVTAVANAAVGAFSMIIQAKYGDVWQDVGVAIVAVDVTDTVVVPAGMAVRVNATSVTTSVDVALIT